MNEQVIRLAQEHGLGHLAGEIERLLISGIHVSKQEAGDEPTGCSRFGGLPDVPAGFVWPSWKDKPLGFLAQIRCEDLAGMDLAEILPKFGILYFFYDFTNQPWGFDPNDRGGAVVLYSDSATPLIRAAMPTGADQEAILFPPFRIRFSVVPTIPSGGTEVFKQLGLNALKDQDYDRFYNFYDAIRKHFTDSEPCHQLLGHPNNVQGEMQLECQLVSHGLYCGDCSAYESPKRAELEPGATEWRLLLQFDSDDDLGLMWGDGGIIYFWVRESDLRAKKFNESWTILQCG